MELEFQTLGRALDYVHIKVNTVSCKISQPHKRDTYRHTIRPYTGCANRERVSSLDICMLTDFAIVSGLSKSVLMCKGSPQL